MGKETLRPFEPIENARIGNAWSVRAGGGGVHGCPLASSINALLQNNPGGGPPYDDLRTRVLNGKHNWPARRGSNGIQAQIKGRVGWG